MRQASVGITYNGADISSDLAPYLKSFQFNDVMSGEADDLSITLEDMAEIWESDWLPEKGATLQARIVTREWQSETEGLKELELGLFEVDEIEYSGMPHEVKIKAVSVPDNNTLRGVQRNRSWEKVKLSEIAGDIAVEAGMQLFFDVEDADDPDLERAEQTEESDLAFLLRLCKDNGLALKITDGQVIIFDEAQYEAKEPVAVIRREGDKLTGYSIRSKTRNVYKACHVKYTDSESGETFEYTFMPDEKKPGKTLEVNEQVKSEAEAERLAKKKLREKNREEITISLSGMGRLDLMAGVTVMISGFHAFDGKCIITRASHSVGGGYTLSLDLRRCLDGY